MFFFSFGFQIFEFSFFATFFTNKKWHAKLSFFLKFKCNRKTSFVNCNVGSFPVFCTKTRRKNRKNFIVANSLDWPENKINRLFLSNFFQFLSNFTRINGKVMCSQTHCHPVSFSQWHLFGFSHNSLQNFREVRQPEVHIKWQATSSQGSLKNPI